MTVRPDPLANQPDFWVTAVINGNTGAIISQSGRRAVISQTYTNGSGNVVGPSAGLYYVLLDQDPTEVDPRGGGAAVPNHVCDVEYDAAAGLFVNVDDLTANVKGVSFTTSADANGQPTAMRYTGWYCK